MYKRLEYNKQSFNTDIYNYIPPQTVGVININKNYGFEKLYTYYPSLNELIDILGNYIYPPVIVTKYPDNRDILIMRAGKEQEELIKTHIKENIALPYPPKINRYKDTNIIICALKDNTFLVYTFYKGLFIMSHNYKLIEATIDADPENSFFSDEAHKEIVDHIIQECPISMFFKQQDNLLAVNYESLNDTITMNGYLLGKGEIDSVSAINKLTHYLTNIPDSICVDSYKVLNKNNLTTVKIILNKMH
ncbi:hypothetical protein JGH11_16425 [Dysgonomonas sp. Marseille-P4677]|uniref:hypothetical protein n=1 Tax=Dysgonomonas sp. Marseille-P4677 TaxID=2364790 RepID=UPI0019148CF7|nr:hypothetical protein [Dysgonomonas sp. Marseille-P4677]MBK5722461.1 hypothetical protein [Dysgonomonas sp. Marseille-P4677]